MRRDILEPLRVFLAVRRWQVIELQLLAQPAGAGREHALRVLLALAGGLIERLVSGRQFAVRVVGTVFCEEETLVVDVASPAAELACFVVAKADPVGIGGQPLQARIVHERCGVQRGAGTERQVGKAFEHVGQLRLNEAEWDEQPAPVRGGVTLLRPG